VLTRLTEVIRTGEWEDNGHASLDRLSLTGPHAVLDITLRGYPDVEGETTLLIRADELVDFEVRSPWGELDFIASGHVTARQHTDTHQALSFVGKPTSATECVVGLLQAHRVASEGWIPFERYLNSELALLELLVSGSGLLADGPSFLVTRYAEVLDRFGVRTNLLEPRSARIWSGTHWRDTPTTLATLIVGETFFVAEDFHDASSGASAV
jgi:hypothetical protein